MSIDVIVCAKNAVESLPTCCGSLRKQELLGSIICVVPFRDRETQEIARQFADITLLEPQNSCLAYARCIGSQVTASDYVAFVDSDVFLDRGHLRELLKFRKMVPRKHVVVEGILRKITTTRFDIDYPEYHFTYLHPNDRGYTHNTLFDRETLLGWKPRYAHAFEDWLLTQYIFSIGGHWYRIPLNARSYHIWNGSLLKRALWNGAGERLVKGISTKQKTKNSMRLLVRGVKNSIIFQDPRWIVNCTIRSIGGLRGHLEWKKYLEA